MLTLYFSRTRLVQQRAITGVSCGRFGTVRLRLGLHWSQNRHNTTVWTDSR